MEEGKVVEKVWGEEEYITNTERYCGKLLHVKAGFACSEHCHPIKDETFYVLAGHGAVRRNSVVYRIKVGDTVRVMPGMWHCFASAGGMTLLEVSSHHDDADVERWDGLESHELSWDDNLDAVLLMASGAVR